ncbi:GTP cyclohydrolase II [Neorickettsia helminthoeca]|nr:GTP cyclohydrolase II [Neorickettsia helminthoeca]
MSLSPDRQARFSLCAFKAGAVVIFRDSSKAMVAVPCESGDVEDFFRRYGENGISLLIPSERFGFYSQCSNEYGVKIDVSKPEKVGGIEKCLQEASYFRTIDKGENLLLLLAKMAEILPEILISQICFEDDAGIRDFALTQGLQILDLESIRSAIGKQKVSRVSEATIHLRNDIKSKMVCYRSILKEHYAIVVGDPMESEEPLVRIHSSCYTGDLLASLSCDCRDQLHDSLIRMLDDPQGGILLYLLQEGRGIGLVNKIRAYDLQSRKGLDTVEANLALGFKDDERDFSIAKQMLDDLGVQKVRLITNNPRKIEQLTAAGIKITHRVPLTTRSNPHNFKYLRTKSERLGHLFTA